MGRPRKPMREKVKKIYIEKNGKISTRELARYAGVSESKIRTWKSEDKWNDALSKQKGAPIGNQNAKGAGAPVGNKNAELHGAYAVIGPGDVPPEILEKIQKCDLDITNNLRTSLLKLRLKEADLESRLAKLEGEPEDDMLDERESEVKQVINGELIPQMTTVSRVSVFVRRQKLEEQLDRVRGRIGKLIESIRAYDADCRRFELEEKKLGLARQKAMGIFDMDDDEDV